MIGLRRSDGIWDIVSEWSSDKRVLLYYGKVDLFGGRRKKEGKRIEEGKK